jgi:S-adenosylmethionine:tRNA-ribosyltransferase-isomerase (queuine synthetase)
MDKEQIIKIAVKAVMDTLKDQERKAMKARYDRRLRNTRLLLKNYNFLMEHCNKSIFNMEQAVSSSVKAIDILDELDSCTSKMFIKSISQSAARTFIILNHVREMLELYEVYCDRSKKDEDRRRYRVIYSQYIDGMEMEAIAEREGVEVRTCYRDSNEACEKLSSLIFGLDGLFEMSKTCQ